MGPTGVSTATRRVSTVDALVTSDYVGFRKWKEEEEIYQLLFKYYNKPDEMLVPAIRPGAGMPCEVINFFKQFKERVKKYADFPSLFLHYVYILKRTQNFLLKDYR